MAQSIKTEFSSDFKKQYKKLPLIIRTKFTKQLRFLAENYRHPSLRTKKMAGINSYEARIDIHYRFTFEIAANSIVLKTIGPHDTGLGKK